VCVRAREYIYVCNIYSVHNVDWLKVVKRDFQISPRHHVCNFEDIKMFRTKFVGMFMMWLHAKICILG